MASFAYIELSSCGGCLQSLLNSGLSLYHLIDELEVVYWPGLTDDPEEALRNAPDGSIDLGIIEGAVRTERDKELVMIMGKKCKKVLTIGSCASFGGIPGLANSIHPISGKKSGESMDAPPLLSRVYPVSKYIHVTKRISGCPPKSGNIIAAITQMLMESTDAADRKVNMCEKCSREKCLLDEGIICFGPVSAYYEGLENVSPESPALGQYGLSEKPHEENAGKLLDMMAAGGLSKSNISYIIKALELILKGSQFGFLADFGDPVRSASLRREELPYYTKVLESGKKTQIVEIPSDDMDPLIKNVLGAALAVLKNDKEFTNSAQTVCSQCDRNVQDKKIIRFKRDYEDIPDPDKCLLIQGYLCMGPITRAGCGATCPRANTPCNGCYGPALNVSDMGAKSLSYFPALCVDEPENIASFFKDPLGLFNRFTYGSSLIPFGVEENKSGK